MEFDLDFVGYGTDICPRTFADGKVESPDGQCAIKNACGALLFESKWCARVSSLAFDSEFAKDFKSLRPQDFDGSRDKFCRRKKIGVEPLLAGYFIVTFAGAGVDTGQINVDLGARRSILGWRIGNGKQRQWRSTGPGWDAQGRVRFDIGREARTVGRGRSSFWRLGNLPHEGFAG